MIALEKRPQPSRAFSLSTPLLAVLATMFFGGLLFAALGKDPFVAIKTIFWEPLFGQYAFFYRPQLMIKGAPLVRKFYDKHELGDFEVLVDKGGKILRASAVRGLPTTLLIDRAGREVGRVTGPLEWDQPNAVALVRACLGKEATAG